MPVLGFLIDRNQEIIYGANLVVQPNFGSAQQLYKNIQYYNNLVQQGDTLLLADTFGITPEEASSLRAFTITPIEDENSTLEAYNRFLRQSTDSVMIKNYTYEAFKKNVSEYNYSIHNVSVMALKK